MELANDVWEISQELLELVAGGGMPPQVWGSGTDSTQWDSGISVAVNKTFVGEVNEE